MLNAETWIIFLSASLALAFAPGPGMLYVLSRTISGGKSAGITSTLGAATGGLIHVFGAAIGVSAILATSALAFMIIKYLGALFLIYLGLKMLMSSFKETVYRPAIESEEKQQQMWTIFYQGIISEVLNPKTALFFLAFIPQFINPSNGQVMIQFIILGLIVVVLNSIPDFLIAFFSKPIEKIWKSSRRFRIGQQVVSGTCLVGLGLYLATSETDARATPTQ